MLFDMIAVSVTLILRKDIIAMGRHNSETNYPRDGKKKGTFIVRVDDNQNGTWHGRVVWADEESTQYFRSTLELLKLIDGALAAGRIQDQNIDESVS